MLKVVLILFFYHCLVHNYNHRLYLWSNIIHCYTNCFKYHKNTVASKVVLIWKKKDYSYNVFDVYIVMIKSVLFVFHFSFIFILLIVPPKVAIFIFSYIVDTIVAKRVVSQFNMIRLMQYFWCTFSYYNFYTFMFVIILLLPIFFIFYLLKIFLSFKDIGSV